MTRSARNVVAGELQLLLATYNLISPYELYADHILTRLAEDEFALADLRTHVVVPREPTEAMIEAGVDAYEHVDCIYKAMLAAIDGDGK